MSTLEDYIENHFSGNITGKQRIPASLGTYAPLPGELHLSLRMALDSMGIRELYSHQAEAFASISANRDTLLVSRTASGKTLSFLLPILNEYLNSPSGFSVLLLYPTKALSRDQEGTLAKLLSGVASEKRLGTFDGDTPVEERQHLQQSGDFIISNPDMLHCGILPNHKRNWKTFLSRLRYIVIDEVHSYRGSFGSQVANVFRRLLRVCDLHGSSPTFICCSATIGNPASHVQALCGREFQILDRDGAPRPERILYTANPSLVRSEGVTLYRKGPASISISLLREASERGIRTICFCRGRQEVERLTRAVTDGRWHFLAERVKPYRGGLLPSERRRLERDLFNGRITTIITTNALELGIDIGDLDLCVLSGHPGSIASFWQQAGRVGRKGKAATIVYLAKDSPVDQYLVNHPEFLTGTAIEQAWLNADNPYIVLQHLPCAAYENPLRKDEPYFASMTARLAVHALTENGTLKPWRDSLRFALQDYPARGVNLRGMTDYNVDIYCGSEVIGEIDPIGARGTLYKDAIYQHLGKRYMSLNLDLEKKLCQVEEVQVDYFTEASWENRIEQGDVDEEKEQQGARLQFGEIHVNKQPKLYKKIRERSFENIGYGPITLPAFEYDTMGFAMRAPVAWLEACDRADKRWFGAALYGLGYLLRRAAPSLCMADVQDIDTDISLFQEEGGRCNSTLYLYDTHEGGVGYAEKIFELIEPALTLCLQILQDCPCVGGCPACVPPLPPGVIDAPDLAELLLVSDASVRCTESLLKVLLNGDIILPKVTVQELPVEHPVTPPGEDPEIAKLSGRLDRAARILQQKREKLH
ncbi:MAG: DEAD/DEAH box helicase [Lentisphaeria bacterium]